MNQQMTTNNEDLSVTYAKFKEDMREVGPVLYTVIRSQLQTIREQRPQEYLELCNYHGHANVVCTLIDTAIQAVYTEGCRVDGPIDPNSWKKY